jgi:ketosteroid isomerase-like protein
VAADRIATLRPIYEQWARGEFGAGAQLLAPDLVHTGFVPEGRVTTHGEEEFGRWVREFLSQWEGYRVLADEFMQVDDDTVLVSGRQYATGRHSGVEVEESVFNVWVFRGEKVVGLHFDPDRERALEAAGLQA